YLAIYVNLNSDMLLSVPTRRSSDLHEQARLALTALRDQIRSIHPQVLTDFGLAEAVRELAERCPIPVEVDLDLPGRLPPEIESRSEEHMSELQSPYDLVCRLLIEKN